MLFKTHLKIRCVSLTAHNSCLTAVNLSTPMLQLQ